MVPIRLSLSLFKICVVLVLFCALTPLNGQLKLPAKSGLEDPEVYCAFFLAHGQASLKIQESKGPAAASLSNATASLYRMNATELPKLTSEVNSFGTAYYAWHKRLQVYLAQQRAAKAKPDMKVLVNFQRQRQRLVMNAHGRIHGALGKASWQGLSGYINSDFAAALHQGKGNAK